MSELSAKARGKLCGLRLNPVFALPMTVILSGVIANRLVSEQLEIRGPLPKHVGFPGK
jgi:hypothetical protein